MFDINTKLVQSYIQKEVSRIKIRISVKCVFLPIVLIVLLNNLSYPVQSKTNTYNIKYVLQWTKIQNWPLKFMKRNQKTFMGKTCPLNNCYITSDRTYFKELTDFHAILFQGPELHRKTYKLPQKRSRHQKYVFVSMESSQDHPITDKRYDNFFNWTWTYKLNSDLYYGYILIRNKQGAIIGPKANMHWLKTEDMQPISTEFQYELDTKTKFAVWITSFCKIQNKTENLIKEIQKELAKYDMKIDIFGDCGSNKCDDDDIECFKVIRHYFFHFSFENSFSEDYVSKKILIALDNKVVPVVFGGADYRRFLPDSAYLDARKLAPKTLVEVMIDAIVDRQKYYDFFRWTNHYTFHSDDEDPELFYCTFCKKLNENKTLKNRRRISFYTHFREWWNV